MQDAAPYQLLADAVLSLHVAIVAFIVGGFVLIVAGNLLSWRWVNAFWFRLMHLAAITLVVAETWIGFICPLTSVEQWLRERARETSYSGGFIEHWLESILYYDFPSWIFDLAYTLFGLIVAAAWWYFPPRRRRS